MPDELETLIQSLTPEEQDQLITALEAGNKPEKSLKDRAHEIALRSNLNEVTPSIAVESSDVGNKLIAQNFGPSAREPFEMTPQEAESRIRPIVDPWVSWGKKLVADETERRRRESQSIPEGETALNPSLPPSRLSSAYEAITGAKRAALHSAVGVLSAPFANLNNVPVVNDLMQQGHEGVGKIVDVAEEYTRMEALKRQEPGELNLKPAPSPITGIKPELQLAMELELFRRAGQIVGGMYGETLRRLPYESRGLPVEGPSVPPVKPVEVKSSGRVRTPEEIAARKAAQPQETPAPEGGPLPTVQKAEPSAPTSLPSRPQATNVISEAELAKLGDEVWSETPTTEASKTEPKQSEEVIQSSQKGGAANILPGGPTPLSQLTEAGRRVEAQTASTMMEDPDLLSQLREKRRAAIIEAAKKYGLTKPETPALAQESAKATLQAPATAEPVTGPESRSAPENAPEPPAPSPPTVAETPEGHAASLVEQMGKLDPDFYGKGGSGLQFISEASRESGKSLAEMVEETIRTSTPDDPIAKLKDTDSYKGLVETLKTRGNEGEIAQLAKGPSSTEANLEQGSLGEEGSFSPAELSEATQNEMGVTEKGVSRGKKGRTAEDRAKATLAASRKPAILEATNRWLSTRYPQFAGFIEKGFGREVLKQVKPNEIADLWNEVKQSSPAATPEDFHKAITGNSRISEKFKKAILQREGPTLGSGLGSAQPLLEKATLKVKEGAKAFRDVVFRRSIDELSQDYGETGRKAAEKIVDIETDADSYYNHFEQRRLDAERAMTPSERSFLSKNMQAAIERPEEVELTPAQENYIKEWKNIADLVEEQGFKAGKRIFDRGTNEVRRSRLAGKPFHPHQLQAEWLEKLQAGDAEALAKFHELNPDVEGNPFGDLRAMEMEPTDWHKEFSKPTDYSTEVGRKYTYPDEWLNQDGFDAHRSYLRDATRSTAEQTFLRYRSPNGKLVNDGMGYIKYWRDKIASERGAQAATEFTNLLKKILRGQSIGTTRGGKWWKNVQQGEAVYSAATKMGGSATTGLKQLAQLPNLAVTGGSKVAWRGVVDAVREWRNQRRTSIVSGAAPRSRSFGDVGGLDLPKVQDKAQHIVDVAIASTFYPDAAMRTVASAAAPHFLEKLRSDLKSGGRAASDATRLLRKMYMTTEEIARIENGTMNNRTITKFRQRLVKETQITTTRGEMPSWASHPALQSALRFKKFAIGQTRFYLDHVFDEAANGNYKPLGRAIAWSLGTGEALGSTKEAIFGPSGRRKDWDRIIKDRDVGGLVLRLADDLDNSAFLGIVGQLAGAGVKEVTQKEKPGIWDHPIIDFMAPPMVRTASNIYDTSVAEIRGDQSLENQDPRTKAALDFLKSEIAFARQVSDAARFSRSQSLYEEIEKAWKSGHKEKAQELSDRAKLLRRAKSGLGVK